MKHFMHLQLFLIFNITSCFSYYKKLDVNSNEHLSYHYCTVQHIHFFNTISFSKQYFKKEITHTMKYLIGSRYLCSKSNNNPPSPFKTRWKFNHFQFNAITVYCIIATNLVFTTALFSTILSITSSSLPFKIIDRLYFLKPTTTNPGDILPQEHRIHWQRWPTSGFLVFPGGCE